MRVFYTSLSTPKMDALIRESAGEAFTLDTDDDAERRHTLTAQTIAAGAKLRLIHHQGVGYHDTVDRNAARQKGLRLWQRQHRAPRRAPGRHRPVPRHHPDR
ncbi:MAG: hypothetical protein AAF318_01130 [Pseudomonadota bacterium]